MNNQIIYIPAYIEQGVELLDEARELLSDIESEIDRGISQILNSGYAGEIPYIGRGEMASSAISSMQKTISTIISELENYNNGTSDLPNDAIIIADIDTASKYNIDPNRIYCSLTDYSKNNSNIKPRWSTDYLTAAMGGHNYYTADGSCVRETWCDLDPSYLAVLMKERGVDLDFWIREDGVYMYGDYVMVAADIPHIEGAEQEAQYRKGDIVETSLGTGMVVDLCGMAEKVRKGEFRNGSQYAEVDVWYDIYTAWHDGGKYQKIGYSDPTNSSKEGVKTLLKAGKEPSSLYNSTLPLQVAAPSASVLNTLSQSKGSQDQTVLANALPTDNSTLPSISNKKTPVSTYQYSKVKTPSSTPDYHQPTTQKPQSTPNYSQTIKETRVPNPNYHQTPTKEPITPSGQHIQKTPTVSTDPAPIATNIKQPQNDNYHNLETVPSPSNNLNNQYEPVTQPSNINEATTNPSLEHKPGVSTIKPEISDSTDPGNTITNTYPQTPEENIPNISQESNNSSSIKDDTLVTQPTKVEMADTPRSFNPIPIIATGGLAIAGGVGAKMYLDHKKNSNNDSTDSKCKDDNELENEYDFTNYNIEQSNKDELES